MRTERLERLAIVLDEIMPMTALIVRDALDLLKEQDAVKPVNVRWERGIKGGNCPKCLNWVQRTYNYCPYCGKGINWDG